MFVQDWVLAILYTDPIVPVVGITSFMKQLFLTLIEFAPEHKIPTENPGFKAYYFGPYSERVEDVILGLEDAGLLATSGRKGTAGEYFILTELGKVPARRSFEKLTKKQQAALIEVRRDWQELGTDGLMKYIYKHYPTYAEESLVLDRVLHNRRLGKRKWGLDDQERPHKSH